MKRRGPLCRSIRKRLNKYYFIIILTLFYFILQNVYCFGTAEVQMALKKCWCKQYLIHYLHKALPLRDKMKNCILLKWLNDKACNWTTTKSTTAIIEKVEVKSKVSGYGTIYDAARLMGMDYYKDKALVDAILEDIPQDDDWDSSNGIQNGYKKAGLKRYKLEHIEMASSQEKDTQMDTTTSVASKKGKVNSVEVAIEYNLQVGAEGGAGVIITHPEYIDMMKE